MNIELASLRSGDVYIYIYSCTEHRYSITGQVVKIESKQFWDQLFEPENGMFQTDLSVLINITALVEDPNVKTFGRQEFEP